MSRLWLMNLNMYKMVDDCKTRSLKKLEERSKFLSYLLRHKPADAGLTLDKEGWCELTELLANTDFTFAELCEIVQQDSKGRYSFDHNSPQHANCIRANQGHSTKLVDIAFNATNPPAVLYHGTSDGAFSGIMKSGAIMSMLRQYVHMTEDLETAKSVGERHKRSGALVVLAIDAKRMLADGHEFFKSENGVWLTKTVPTEYLTQIRVTFDE